MIEPLLMEDYEGQTVCRYFPPRTQFAEQILQSERVTIVPIPSATQDVNGFWVDRAVEVRADNGAAVYLLGNPDEDGIREAVLWGLKGSDG